MAGGLLTPTTDEGNICLCGPVRQHVIQRHAWQRRHLLIGGPTQNSNPSSSPPKPYGGTTSARPGWSTHHGYKLGPPSPCIMHLFFPVTCSLTHARSNRHSNTRGTRRQSRATRGPNDNTPTQAAFERAAVHAVAGSTKQLAAVRQAKPHNSARPTTRTPGHKLGKPRKTYSGRTQQDSNAAHSNPR